MTFPISRQGMEQIAILMAIGAAFFAATAFWRAYRRGPWRRSSISSGVLGGAAAFALVLGYTVAPNIPTQPVPFTARFAQNPVPDTPANVDSGRALFQQNCSVCHGPRGLGDGPAAFTLNPRPFNLVVHVPQHATGEIFYWISEGVPGTQMPAWKENLTDTQRWHIVRYLGVLAAGGS
jgi:putative copper resistance protein D